MFLCFQDYKVVASVVLQKSVQIRSESLPNNPTHPLLVRSQWSGRCNHLCKKENLSETSPHLFQLIPPKMMTDLYTTCGAPVKRLARWKTSGVSADLINLHHVLRFPAGSHNETWACSDYYQTITYFLDEVNSCKYCQVLSNNCQVLYLNRESGRARAASPSTLVSHSTVLTV